MKRYVFLLMCALLVLSTSVISTTASSEENEPTVVYNDDGTVTIIGAESWEEASSALRKDISDRKEESDSEYREAIAKLKKSREASEETEPVATYETATAIVRDNEVFIILCIIAGILFLNLIVNIRNRIN